MAITLRLLDQRVADQTKEIEEDIPLPAVSLSVFRAAQMTVRRARRRGYVGTGIYTVLLRKSGEMESAFDLDHAKTSWVPDGSTVTVRVESGQPRTTSDRWLID